MRSDYFYAYMNLSQSLIFQMQEYRNLSFLKAFVGLFLENIAKFPKQFLTYDHSLVWIFIETTRPYMVSDQNKCEKYFVESIFYPYGVFPKNPELLKILFDNSENVNYDIFKSSDKLSNAVDFEHNQSRYVIKNQYKKVLNAICLRLTRMDKFCFAFQKIVIKNCVNLANLFASFILTVPVGRFGKPDDRASQADYLPWMMPI